MMRHGLQSSLLQDCCTTDHRTTGAASLGAPAPRCPGNRTRQAEQPPAGLLRHWPPARPAEQPPAG
eukprot:6967707-Pyramimonas_sp.AAC.1